MKKRKNKHTGLPMFVIKIRKRLRELRILNFLILILAGAINAFGVVFFLFPVKRLIILG